MYLHANAKLGLAGRLALVRAVEDGLSLRGAAAAFSVSPATAHRWWHRWLEGGRQPQALLDRSSRPEHSPRLLAAELQERICDCRRQTGWGPRLVAGATGFPHSTVWKVLRRNGLSRRAAAVKEPANSYEWPCPGDLLHMDTSRYARFLRPGHRGHRRPLPALRHGREPETRVGYDYAHAIVDEHRESDEAEAWGQNRQNSAARPKSVQNAGGTEGLQKHHRAPLHDGGKYTLANLELLRRHSSQRSAHGAQAVSNKRPEPPPRYVTYSCVTSKDEDSRVAPPSITTVRRCRLALSKPADAAEHPNRRTVRRSPSRCRQRRRRKSVST